MKVVSLFQTLYLINMDRYVSVFVCVHVCMCVCVCVCMCTCMHVCLSVCNGHIHEILITASTEDKEASDKVFTVHEQRSDCAKMFIVHFLTITSKTVSLSEKKIH